MNETTGNSGGAQPPEPPKQPETPKPPPSPSPETPKPAISDAAKRAATQAAPARPAPPKVASPGRRKFFNWFFIAWTAFAAATGGALALCLRFMFPNVLFEPKSQFTIGFPDDYEIGVVDLRWKNKFAIWVVRVAEGMYALSTICTHLGCTPNWLENEKKFKCPCHGSGFTRLGINFEGPAPRPLERFRIGLADDGQVLIDKSKKFQQEKGEWNNPESFLTL